MRPVRLLAAALLGVLFVPAAGRADVLFTPFVGGNLGGSVTSRFADFVGKLAATQDGEGTLLDNSMLLYGSNMSNSNKHNNYPLPNILVGGGAGALKGGRQIELPERTTISNLHLTLLNMAGLEKKSFGDSTGEIAGV